MESAVGHPLQALADALTLAEHPTPHRPKVVLSWHCPEGTPHAVGNSFTNMMQFQEADYVIANPEGYDLNPEIPKEYPSSTTKKKPFKTPTLSMPKLVFLQSIRTNFEDRRRLAVDRRKMALTNNAKFMHCLPVRRNIVADGVLDHPNSLVIEQANNRTYAAPAVLKTLLDHA